MTYQEYIKPELMVLVPVLYFIGKGLKKSKIPDKWIPTIIGMISVMLAAIWVIATEEFAGMKDAAEAFFVAVTQGILLAGASVYTNQLYRQGNKEE